MDDEMKNLKIIRLSELVQVSRPLSGAASFNLSSSTSSVPRSTCSPSISNSKPRTSTPNPNPNHRVLTALKYPTIVVGTLALPSHDAWTHSRCSCFQFSDGTGTVCCDVLEFDVCVIGKEIRVYAWNFIPFKRGQRGNDGFLEIIKWGFPGASEGLRKGVDSLNRVGSFPLAPSCSGTHPVCSPSPHLVFGVLESVGPLIVVPCTMLPSGSKGFEDRNSSSAQNLPGFLAHVVCCECRLCGSKELLTDLSGLIGDRNIHSFTKPVVVYFVDHAWSWHSVITKLSGNCIMVSGLKKKLVFIGKEESCIMYVTTNKSALHVCQFSKKWLSCLKISTNGRGKSGTYTGIIRGIHMQGMVLELDCDVWLLLTDEILTLSHSLRVGAIISVRNVRFVDPKFSWTKTLILGACVKTSIVVESFSPLETMCHAVSQSPSELGKFIGSLPFSARLWVLLLVSSLRKKFGGILSDKDLLVLGSKNKEGLAQMCASSQLPSSVLQNQHGAFMGLCRHDSYGCGRELHCGAMKLAIPMSSFICHCRSTLLRMLKSGNDCKLLTMDNHLRFLSCEERSYGRSVRRIISSKDVGCLLLGYLKVNTSTGRLQLIDATGSIDVIIPDLPLTWDHNKLYEVMDYNIIVDGASQLVDHLELNESETLSCRTIFNCTYTQASRHMKNDSRTLEPGCYHLLRVSHKFPLLQKMSNTSSTFVEAMLLPWSLLLNAKNGNLHSPKVSRGKIKEFSDNCINGDTNSKEQVSYKRQKLVKEPRSSLVKDEFGSSICEMSACSNSFSKPEEDKSCINLSSYHMIPCLVTFSGIQNENVHSSAILHSTLSVVDKDVDSQPTARKVLLELLSERFLKYQLQIGGYYIIKHHKKDCFCTLKDAQCSSSVKVPVESGKDLWSLSFVSDEGLQYFKSAYSSKQDIMSPSIDGIFPRDQIEHPVLGSNVNTSCISSDVCLYIPANLKDLLQDNIMEPDGQGQPSASTGTVAAGPPPSSGSFISNLFPEGNLISLQGDVVDCDDLGSSFSNSCFTGLNALQLKGFVGARSSLCIHVLVDQHIVKIFGSVSKQAFPTGFGVGVSATFHRILAVRSQIEFLLLPVSCIVINSIRVYHEPHISSSSKLWSTTHAHDAFVDYSSGLISDLNQCPSHKQTWLRCRVVAVFVLALESNTTIVDLQAKSNASGPLFNIPLAGFVLDDGSSSCCCWANAERAATLLRLHEELPKRACEKSNFSLKRAWVNDNASSTATYHLGRILKTYKRITVKNYGSCFDSPHQHHVISATSGNALCSSDENLLKFIIFNSCFGRIWNVATAVMNAEEVSKIQKAHHVETDIMHIMPNIWAKEVCYMSTLTEARNMVQQF